MADVLGRCRRLGFPLFIKTNKKIGDLRAVELLWLFYYLLEIYEPAWSHSPTGFTKSNYKPLANAMRLLELAHKCPKSKELKKPQEYKRNIASSLGAVLDKLEAKFGANKLYSTRFQHPSVKGMQSKNEAKKSKTKVAVAGNENHDNRQLNPPQTKMNANDKNKNKQIPIPRAKITKLKDLNNANIPSYESKAEETEQNVKKHHAEEKAVEISEPVDCDSDIVMQQVSHTPVVNEERKEVLQPVNDFTNNYNYEACDLNAYNFKVPKYNNETVKFHVELQINQEQLSMTQKYEQLQRKQAEKTEKINNMKKEYDFIANELQRAYSFQAKSFQNTSSTDYALFQLESIKQKLKSQQEITNEKTPVPMDQDGMDRLLNNLSDQVQNWSNNTAI